jgi:hypothetical protein
MHKICHRAIHAMLSERELPQRRLVRVPDVVGLPLRKALLLVQQAGLRATSVLYKESYEEKDTVLEQRPQRGQMVYASEDVSLWVSRDSYIKWLPAIYQRSDTTGRNVVRDLLWIIQHLFGSIEQVLETEKSLREAASNIVSCNVCVCVCGI